MPEIVSQIEQELRRLKSGLLQGEQPSGIGTVQFSVSCRSNENIVLERTKAILQIIDEASLSGWPSDKSLKLTIPEWFVTACAPEMSTKESQQWLARWYRLSRKDQIKLEDGRKWSLKNWLDWMEPTNREWFWWDATVLKDHEGITLAVQVQAWPYPWGALRWLLLAAGAYSVEAKE